MSGCCQSSKNIEKEACGCSHKLAAEHENEHQHDALPQESHHHGKGCCGHNHNQQAATPLPADITVPPGYVKGQWQIAQMDCPMEEGMIRKKLEGAAYVYALSFNLLQHLLTVIYLTGNEQNIEQAIKSLNMTPVALVKGKKVVPLEAMQTNWVVLAISGACAVAAEVAHWMALPEWLSASLALIAVLTCGLTTYKKGWIAIKNANLNINALMSVAVTGAFIIGQWPEAAMVMFLFSISELIEARSLDRARNAISDLLKLAPEHATVKQPDGSWQPINANEVTVGNVVRVKPGERIALDGVLVNGQSTVNQAPITGESLSVEKAVGDTVFAGTINEAGAFDYKVTAGAQDTTLARIIHAVEEAQGSKAPMQRFVDQFALIYTPIVFIVAVLVAIVPPLFMSALWLPWIYKALVLLVIACPCAFVISTPVTIVSGLAAAARKGILIKGGVYLEQGYKLSWLALDKTGTITHGKPVQTDVENCSDLPENTVRQLAATLASESGHPVSRAIAGKAVEENITTVAVSEFMELSGRGVKGNINGECYYLGNHRLIEELKVCSPELESRLDALESQGKTALMLASKDRVLGLFAVADTVRDSSREAIDSLSRLGVKTIMLTGDNTRAANAIAKTVGINEVRGEQLPADKLAAIEEKMQSGEQVGMVGDGINDAPALAKASIGFAMGAAGTDTAIETADVALMDDDLRKIPTFIRLSRHTRSVLVQNIVLALGIKIVFLVLTMLGIGTMWMAVFADVGASLIVVFNGLRLLRS